jgi:maleylacetoacetate isomerase
MRLYNFHRSSSSYRIRIALALKGIDYEYVAVKLSRDDGEAAHTQSDYATMNPQKLVPLLEDGELRISQSLAILEYLERKVPEPALFPSDDAGRARVWSLSSYICSEIQPLQCMRVEKHLNQKLGLSEAEVTGWRRHWIGVGYEAVEAMLSAPATGRFCHGDAPSAADCYLVPQTYNARGSGVDMTRFPRIERIVAHCLELPAFADTAPAKMPDHQPA